MADYKGLANSKHATRREPTVQYAGPSTVGAGRCEDAGHTCSEANVSS